MANTATVSSVATTPIGGIINQSFTVTASHTASTATDYTLPAVVGWCIGGSVQATSVTLGTNGTGWTVRVIPAGAAATESATAFFNVASIGTTGMTDHLFEEVTQRVGLVIPPGAWGLRLTLAGITALTGTITLTFNLMCLE